MTRSFSVTYIYYIKYVTISLYYLKRFCLSVTSRLNLVFPITDRVACTERADGVLHSEAMVFIYGQLIPSFYNTALVKKLY